MFFVSHGGGLLKKDEFNDVIEKAENDMRDDMSKMGFGCLRVISCFDQTPMNDDSGGCGTLWRCSAVSLPLLRRNRDNISSSKENRIGAKFPHQIRGGVDAVKFFNPLGFGPFSYLIANANQIK